MTPWSRPITRLAFARLASLASALLLLLVAGCDRDLSRAYEFVVQVSSEPGRAVPGARVSTQGRALGVADESGAVHIEVRGREGDVLSLDVTCPSGHRSPPPVLVPLRQMGRSGGGRGATPEFAAECVPLTHSLVVAVRAEHGPHLPLLHLGRELGRTDSSGAAHLHLDVASEDVVELVLDTGEQPRLRPRNPILRIQPGSRDEIVAASQDFTLLPPPPMKRVVTPRGPTRIE